MSGSSLTSTWNPPTLPDPTPPDFYLCDQTYGSLLVPAECLNAANRLPQGPDSVNYLLHRADAEFSLPISLSFGSCHISIEANTNTRAQAISFTPNLLRNMAAIVIQRCVQGESGNGGFITFGLQSLINYIINPVNTLTGPYPSSATFITVTVLGPQKRDFFTADTDPSIPQTLAGADYNQARLTGDPGLRALYVNDASLWTLISLEMMRGGTIPWWHQTDMQDQMTYECDAGLGSPSAVDCAKIEYSELGPPSDTISVRPEEVTFLHSKTCFLGISASVPTVLTWTQIRAALLSLVNQCVGNPVSAARGGRAYFGTQPIQSSGRKRKQRDVTGLNALPPGAKLIIWEQQESWTNPSVELKTCTWSAIQKGIPVSTCHIA